MIVAHIAAYGKTHLYRPWRPQKEYFDVTILHQISKENDLIKYKSGAWRNDPPLLSLKIINK